MFFFNPTHVIDLSYLRVWTRVHSCGANPHSGPSHSTTTMSNSRSIKVQWDNYSPHLATWEDAYDMRQQFPFLFDS
jgi:hypothetical protein